MVAQAAADTISKLLNVESLSADNRTAAGIASGDTSGRAAIATGLNAEYRAPEHPLDDQLIAELLEFATAVTRGMIASAGLHLSMGRTTFDAVIRRLRSTF